MGSITRRTFLVRCSALAGATLAGSALTQWLTTMGRETVTFAQGIFDRVKGLPPEITSTDHFYIVSKNPPGLDPVVDGRKWRLEIRGLVRTPMTFRYDQIRAMP